VLDQPHDLKRIGTAGTGSSAWYLAAALYALDVLVFTSRQPLVDIFRDWRTPEPCSSLRPCAYSWWPERAAILAGIILTRVCQRRRGHGPTAIFTAPVEPEPRCAAYQPDEFVRAHQRLAGIVARAAAWFVCSAGGIRLL